MPFLNPLVLLGLAAAAIPIVVHLFNFRRPRRIDFPSLRFVRELERKAMRRVRLRQWLLLALRTLAILALVVAFARPLLPSAWRAAFGARPPAAVALVVDNSLSMTLRDERGAFFDQARAVAAALADAAPAGDALALVPTAGPAGRPASAPGPVLDAIDELRPSHGADALAAAAARAGSMLEEDPRPRRELYLVSDLQASTLGGDSGHEIPPGVRVVLVPVGEGAQANDAVTDVRIASRVIEPGRPVRLTATVSRFGGASGRVGVRVILDGEPVGEGAVDVTPGTPASITLTVTPPRPGWIRGEVRLAEGDAYPTDDARPFVFETPRARRVLLVRGPSRGVEYVRLALGLGAETGSVVVNEVPESALPAAGLGSYDVVVLVGPRAPAAAAPALSAFVRGGGGVLLMPGESAEPGALSELLGALGGGRVADFSGAPGGPSLGALGDVDLEHPLLAGLLAREGRIEGPAVSFVARYFAGGGDEATVARLAAGPPFLQEIRSGRGATLFLAVAPDPSWSDFPTRGLFAPLMLRSVDYLASAGSAADRGALVAGRPGTIRLEGGDPREPIEVLAPDGVVVPSQMRAVPGAVLLDVDTPGRPGVYSVRQGGETLRLVAVQPDAGESDLGRLSPEAAAARLSTSMGREVTVLDARGAAGAAALERQGRGTPLWTVCLAVALAALIAETVVATRWKTERVPA